jgi:hypothetical protein
VTHPTTDVDHADAAPGATPDLPDALRLEVGRFRAAERRRDFPTALHAGTPAGPRLRIEVTARPPHLDEGLRAELAVSLLDRARAALGDAALHVWVTRRGVPERHDEDQLWYAAARWASASLDERLRGFFVVTKGGWLDVATGERRVWKRLRL